MAKYYALGALVIGLFATGFYIGIQGDSKEQLACMESVIARHNYIGRKLCDPMSEEVCAIDIATKIELDDWLNDELDKCQ